MSGADRDPSRWKNAPASSGSPAERWLGDALRLADAAARSTVSASERAGRRRTAALAWTRSGPRRWSLVVAALLVAVAAGTTFAKVYRAVVLARTAVHQPSVDRASSRTRARARDPAASVTTAVSTPPPAPPPIARAKPAVSRAVAMARPAAATAVNVPPAPPLGAPLAQNLAPARAPNTAPPATTDQPPTEARLLARALWRLRTANDPAGALKTLAERDRAFGSGRLGAEAALIRVESLLQMGNNGAALVSLNALPAERIDQSRRLSLLRGELRASNGACAGAVEDLERVLRDSAADAWAERAHYARAACQARLGNVATAREELRLYLDLFPNGPHHRDALRYLAR
jgi:hypothetical protein